MDIEYTKGKKLPFSNIDQVGVIVRDMDKAIKHYESLGIGPFKPLGPHRITERTIRGKPARDIQNVLRVAWVGGVQLELCQPLKGESIQMEFLRSRGEGINHLGFFVDDIDKESATLVKKGFEIIASTRFLNGGGIAYFNTGDAGVILFELIQWPAE
ncbi:VOC family protein [Chloroflexota bacterium]